MLDSKIVPFEAWLAARRDLLAEEKALTRARDALSAKRREMPLVRVDRTYRFETEQGEQSLADLFGPCRQLITMHFMFGPDWEEGCPSCAFWADGYSGIQPHLKSRDTAFVAVSNAPLAVLLEYRSRMGWNFPWVSALDAHFSCDFGVTFMDGEAGRFSPGYNYTGKQPSGEMPGVSVFCTLPDGGIGHSYSAYGRGIDPMNTAYQFLDLTPNGRGEDGLDYPMSWVRQRDRYE